MSDALDNDTSSWDKLQKMGRGIAAQPNGAELYASLTPEERMRRAKEGAYFAASFAPVTGEVISGKEAVEDFQKGNYGMATLGALGAIPLLGYGPRVAKGLLKSGGNVLNRAAENMPTHLKNFYSGNPIAPFTSFGKEFTKAVPSAIKESTSAAQRANKRVKGVSDTKINDILSEDGKHAEYTALSIQRQLPDTQNTLLEKSPIALNYLDSRIPRADVSKIEQGIGGGFRAVGEIPSAVSKRATTHLTDGPHVTRPKEIYEYQIKDPAAAGNLGYVESVAAAKTGPPIIRALRGQVTDTYLNTVNNIRKSQGLEKATQLSPKDMVEFMQISSTLDKTAITALKAKGIKGQDGKIVESLLIARAKQAAGKTLGASQQKLLSEFDNLLDTGKIKLARVSDESGNAISSRNLSDLVEPQGHLFTQQSFVSRQQELGGMNAFIAVDPSTQNMYTMLSDGHDIFGQTPVGGTHLITAFPLIESSYKTGSKYNNKQITTRKTKANIKASIAEVEATTGIPKKNSETPENYTKRAFKESQIQPTAEDISAARQSTAKLAAAGTVGAGAGVGTGLMMANDEE